MKRLDIMYKKWYAWPYIYTGCGQLTKFHRPMFVNLCMNKNFKQGFLFRIWLSFFAGVTVPFELLSFEIWSNFLKISKTFLVWHPQTKAAYGISTRLSNKSAFNAGFARSFSCKQRVNWSSEKGADLEWLRNPTRLHTGIPFASDDPRVQRAWVHQCRNQLEKWSAKVWRRFIYQDLCMAFTSKWYCGGQPFKCAEKRSLHETLVRLRTKERFSSSIKYGWRRWLKDCFAGQTVSAECSRLGFRQNRFSYEMAIWLNCLKVRTAWT